MGAAVKKELPNVDTLFVVTGGEGKAYRVAADFYGLRSRVFALRDAANRLSDALHDESMAMAHKKEIIQAIATVDMLSRQVMYFLVEHESDARMFTGARDNLVVPWANALQKIVKAKE